MKSKEALKKICLECEKEKSKNYVRCPFRSISNEYCEEYETVKKDLDRLEKLEKENKVLKEIIKDNFSYFEDSKKVFFNYTEPVMEEEIREVLENV